MHCELGTIKEDDLVFIPLRGQNVIGSVRSCVQFECLRSGKCHFMMHRLVYCSVVGTGMWRPGTTLEFVPPDDIHAKIPCLVYGT